MAQEVTIHAQLEQIQKKSNRSPGEHSINLGQARAGVKRKRSDFARDFDRWTRSGSKEQQDDSSLTRNSKDKQKSVERDERRDNLEHQQHGEQKRKNREKSKLRDYGLSL